MAKLAFDRSRAARAPHRLALDRGSVRTVDRDGRLHIAVSNMAKAGVDQYLGEEIPGCRELGLDPTKLYRMLRDPEELEKGTPTFNNLPILAEHIPVSAEAPQQETIIGSTGTDARFEAPFLRNSAVIWVQDAIDDIDSEKKRDWSPGYYFTPDMTPGNFNGLPYDGIMRNIVGNHVALVDEGRQGRDVVVGDHLPEQIKMLKSRRALMLQGALSAIIAPQLAMDAKLDLKSALGKVTAKTRGKDADKLAASIFKLAKPKLAQDAELDVQDVVAIINAVDGNDDDADDYVPDDAPADADRIAVNDADDDDMAKVMAFLQGKLSDEDMAALGELIGKSDDSDDDNDDDGDTPAAAPAMDAATIRKLARAEMADIRTAERAVAPHIGEVAVAMDSAASIYKLALDNAGVDLKGVPTAAYAAMVRMLPVADAGARAPLAMDRVNASKSFADRFPEANTLLAS